MKRAVTDFRLISFVEKSKLIYQNLYNYSNVKLFAVNTPVEIICKIHGSFSVQALSHLYNLSSCPSCSKIILDRDYIVSKLTEIYKHNNYDLTTQGHINYKKVKGICPEHGIFEMNLFKHLFGKHCLKCEENLKIRNKKINNECLTHLNNLYNNYYDYTKSNFGHLDENIIITCPNHGDFKKKLINHMNGFKCGLCEKEEYEIEYMKTKSKYNL